MADQEPTVDAPMRTRHLVVTAAALWLAFGALYWWTTPSLAHQHWDSLEYASVVEAQRPNAVWGNHPLGHLVQQAVYRAALALGYTGRALHLLQGLGVAAMAGATAWFFVLLSTTLSIPLVRAIGWTVVMGSTWGVAHYAGTADIYGMAALTVVAALHGLAALSKAPSARRAVLAGVLAGTAGLTHQFGLVIAGAAAAGLLRVIGFRRAVWLGVATLGTVVVGYGVIGTFVTPNGSPAEIIRWVRGYGTDPTYGQFFNPIGAVMGIASLAQTVLGWTESPNLSVVRYGLLALAIVLFAGLMPADGERTPLHRTWTRAGMLACIAAWLLIVWWEPGNRKFWLLTMPTVALVMACRRPVASSSATAAFPLLLGVVWLAFNLSAGLRADHRPNDAFEKGLNGWLAHSEPGDVLLENSDYTAHLLLWGDRPNTANTYRLLQGSPDPNDPYAKLRQVIEDAWRDGRDVLMADGLSPYFNDMRLSVVGTTRSELAAFFEGFRREGPVFQYRNPADAPPTLVYRLVR